MVKKHFSVLFNHFIRGLLLTVPIILTTYVISLSINFINNIIPLPYVPGLGILCLFIIISFIGYLASKLSIQPIFDIIDKFITQLPLVNTLYGSFKEFIDAFLGEKRKFTKPVYVITNPTLNLKQLGFVTQENLESLNLPDHISVYIPYSYSFAGYLIIVPKDKVTFLNVSSTDAMKFLVSGGITQIPLKNNKGTEEKEIF